MVEPRIQVITVRDRFLHWQRTETEFDLDVFNELSQAKLSIMLFSISYCILRYAYLSYRSHQDIGHVCRACTFVKPANSSLYSTML